MNDNDWQYFLSLLFFVCVGMDGGGGTCKITNNVRIIPKSAEASFKKIHVRFPDCKMALRWKDYKLLDGNTGGRSGWYPVPGVDDAMVMEDEEKPPKTGYQLYNIRGTLTFF